MRGKAACHSCLRFVRRITPAYAGKSSHLDKSFHGHRDHPRLCGEKLAMLAKLIGKKGITPAYAGKRKEGDTVHWYETGSPPPMRGKE